jgi:predicted Rossmann fold flavoprotein
MTTALECFGHDDLTAFFARLGVETHAPDGYRVFPITHNSETILTALEKELEQQHVELRCGHKAHTLIIADGHVAGIVTDQGEFFAEHVIIATGGLGYPQLGAEGDGHDMAEASGHTITGLHPAMMPLHTKERWVEQCRADTIPRAQIKVALKKAKKLHASGDLIFTKNGIRGPVVLDFSREITPLLEKYGEVPLLINMTRGMNEEQIYQHLKKLQAEHPDFTTLDSVATLLPRPLSEQLCELSGADPLQRFNRLGGSLRDRLVKLLAWTPLTVTGHDGFKMAMITRGGISLKEIEPTTMQSKKLKGLYFCGEVMNLDGPCGGYNLQWSFSSGYLAGLLRL